MKDGAEVATTAYQSLDELNTAFTDLVAVSDGLDTMSVNVYVDTDGESKILVTREIKVNPKVNNLTATMTVTEFIQNVPKATAIEFSGTMDRDSASIVVTPIDCTIKGVKYAPNTEYNEDNPCSFTAESLEKINERFRNITLTADGTLDVKVKVVVDDSDPIEIDLTVAEYVPSTIIFTAPNFEELTFKKDVESESFDLDFTGSNLQEYDPVTVKITPENCTMKRAANENNGNTEIEITDTNPFERAYNNNMVLMLQMTGFTLTPTADEDVKFIVQCSKDDGTAATETVDITVTPTEEEPTPPNTDDGGEEDTPPSNGDEENNPSGE